MTSALSVVVTESQMVAQASRVVAAGIQTNADLFHEPHNQPNCNPLKMVAATYLILQMSSCQEPL
ncbi:hypothetical protein [Nostoc sp.]|uniref:hypothetical protein n=1 Tax=Nostoc sp. TaxID=1180 RepID=UPI002FF9240B